jgi:hypothetical protein
MANDGIDGLVVYLTKSELVMAGGIGLIRRTNGIFRDLKQNGVIDAEAREFSKPPWETDVVGAQSEYAVSKFLNLSWSGARMDKPLDVGNLIEVKYVEEAHHRLPLSLSTAGIADVPYVCVHAKDDRFAMLGWAFPVEVQRKEFEDRSKGREMCWLVNQSALRDMDELKAWVRDRLK